MAAAAPHAAPVEVAPLAAAPVDNSQEQEGQAGAAGAHAQRQQEQFRGAAEPGLATIAPEEAPAGSRDESGPGAARPLAEYEKEGLPALVASLRAWLRRHGGMTPEHAGTADPEVRRSL